MVGGILCEVKIFMSTSKPVAMGKMELADIPIMIYSVLTYLLIKNRKYPIVEPSHILTTMIYEMISEKLRPIIQ